MICKLEIYNGELKLFPVVTNERVFAQITMGNIVKGQPGKSPIIGENDNWWIWDDAEGKYVDSGKVATTSDDVVKYVEAKDEQHPNRKAIQLNNGDMITGIAKKEGLGSVNIAMVNEWDVVDLGSSELPINMNTPKGVRPTVQEAGQSGEESNKIAYLSDLEDIGFITNGDGTKFLSDDGSYKTITPTSSEVKAPTLVISTEKKLSSSSMTELSDYIKPEVQFGKIPIELFLNCIYCLNVEAGQTPIYTKPYTVLSNTFEQVAVIKVMVPDIVNKKFNGVTINIDQATRAITVSETVTLSDM